MAVSEHELKIAVVIVPLPVQGHLNSLLHLSSHIASRRIHVHYVCSATHNRQARARLHGWNLASAASHLHFHDLPFPSTPSPSPNPLQRFPTHLKPSFDAAFDHLLPHLSSLLLSLSPSHHRIALLHDVSIPFAPKAASPISNAEAFAFNPTSAFTSFFFLLEDGKWGISLRSCFGENFLDFFARQQPVESQAAGLLYNTCRGIEGTFPDRLSKEPTLKGQKIFAVGPLNPVVVEGRSEGACLSWLDQQAPESVLYVSFGTTTSMSTDQLRELAAGLEESRLPFIWAHRDADRCDIFQSSDQGEEDFDFVDFRKRNLIGILAHDISCARHLYYSCQDFQEYQKKG